MNPTASDLPALSAELKAFEADLAALTPDEASLDRARLLFEAGRASARLESACRSNHDRSGRDRAARVWAGAFGVMSVIAASLLFVLVARPSPPVEIVERRVEVPVADSGAVERGTATDGTLRRDSEDGPRYLLRYPMPERTSPLAAAIFGMDDELARPIVSSESLLAMRHNQLLRDIDDPPPRSRNNAVGDAGGVPEEKSRHELLRELLGNNT